LIKAKKDHAASSVTADRGSAQPRRAVLRWLLSADPAIRWQAMRDLTEEPAASVAAERSRVGRKGWGARLLKRQDPKGFWGGEVDRRTWLRTMDALVLLKDFGLDPASEEARSCIGRVRDAQTRARTAQNRRNGKRQLRIRIHVLHPFPY